MLQNFFLNKIIFFPIDMNFWSNAKEKKMVFVKKNDFFFCIIC